MTTAQPGAGSRSALARGDRLVLGFLGFSIAAAFTVELYFLLNFQDIHVQTGSFARLFEIYGAGDRTYYGEGDVHLPYALETINVFAMQILNCLLGYAIVRHRSWRHPLQLLIGTYLAGSVVLYFWHAHVAGYPDMPDHRLWNYFIFYAPNLPWLVGNAWLAAVSYRYFVRRESATTDRSV
ncbi:EXPERA domain-containing protein [Streptomyces sp. NBRC 110611]|uniref:EXPERA domain-containing protein n=1 Tax=Streptomyces sp. NBRC 110611 TaxID=1621259 RepID=UPI0015EE3FA2|nr:emopamil-binding family protein [Streptomyces sp. NBRC 110611]